MFKYLPLLPVVSICTVVAQLLIFVAAVLASRISVNSKASSYVLDFPCKFISQILFYCGILEVVGILTEFLNDAGT